MFVLSNFSACLEVSFDFWNFMKHPPAPGNCHNNPQIASQSGDSGFLQTLIQRVSAFRWGRVEYVFHPMDIGVDDLSPERRTLSCPEGHVHLLCVYINM